MATIAVNGATLGYDDSGSGDPPFLFVHGWVCNRGMFAAQVGDLVRDHRCASVDLRGCGESEPAPPFNVTTAADDLAALAEAIGLPPAIVVGHSLGGIVALRLNERHPERVLGIVAVDSPLAASSGVGGIVERIRESGSMEPAAGLVDSFFRDGTPAGVRDQVATAMLGAPADVAAGMLEEVPELDLTSLLRLADQKPFMALWTTDRPLGDVEWLRSELTFLRHEPVRDAGHFLQMEQPEITNALLRAFVDDVRRDPRLAS